MWVRNFAFHCRDRDRKFFLSNRCFGNRQFTHVSQICTVRFTFVRFLFFNDPRSQSFQLENWIPLNRIEQNRQSTKLNSCSKCDMQLF